VQQQVTLEENRKLVGKTLEVMVEGESKLVSGRRRIPRRKSNWDGKNAAVTAMPTKTQLVGRTRGDQVVCFDGDLSLKGESSTSKSPTRAA
jgi:hypothetical protein